MGISNTSIKSLKDKQPITLDTASISRSFDTSPQYWLTIDLTDYVKKNWIPASQMYEPMITSQDFLNTKKLDFEEWDKQIL
jgi:hypothetical protein